MKLLDQLGLQYLIEKFKERFDLKQDKLTAGDNITITSNTISATDTVYDDTAVQAELGKKADKTYVDSQDALKADKTYVDNKVKTDVPENAVFTDTNTTYTEITTAEIDAGTSTTRRTITGRRVKYILDKVESIPSGLISMWSGLITAIPDGWALCNGENGTPNLTDRFIVGAGSSYSVGDTGGEESVTLSSSQIPRHRHASGTLSTSSDGDHSHSGSSASAGSHTHTEGTLEIKSAGSHSHGSGTYSTDSGGSHTHKKGTLSTNSTGAHTHSYKFKYGPTNLGKGNEQIPLFDKDEYTSSAGSHSHSISGSTASGGSHSHSVSGTSSSGGSHAHDISGKTSSTGSHSHTVTIDTAGSHSHTVSGYTNYIGSGGSHENRPPYYALAFIMKL